MSTVTRNRTFVAKYPGRCADCGIPFEEGDTLMYDQDDQVVHTACIEHASALRPPTVCHRCFMAKAVNGSCPGCDE